MSIQDLIAIIPPPNHPTRLGDPAEWPQREADFGVALPSDYKDFITHYGSGCLGNLIVVYNLYSKPNSTQLARRLEMNREAIMATNETYELPFSIYPDSPGLLTWAHDENSNYYAWLTKGKPDTWPVVAVTGELHKFDQYKFGMTEFLVKAFRHKIKCKCFPKDYPTPVEDFIFTPFKDE